MAETTRWRIPTPELSDNADIPADMRDLALALDDFKKSYQGLLADLPDPGVIGREYFATDDRTAGDGGTLWQDDGTRWVAIGAVQAGSINRVKLADDSVERRHLTNAAVGGDELADNAVSTRHLTDAAVGGAELANRAVGTRHLNPTRTNAVGGPVGLTTGSVNCVQVVLNVPEGATALVFASCYMDVLCNPQTQQAGRAVITMDGVSTNNDGGEAAQMVSQIQNTNVGEISNEIDLTAYSVYSYLRAGNHTWAIAALKDSNASSVTLYRPRIQVILL